MSKFFFKDKKLVKLCKVCKVIFRPDKGSKEDIKGLCWEHRFGERKKKFFRMTPAEKKEHRRLQALEGYHRRKHLRPKRKKMKFVVKYVIVRSLAD